MLTILFYSFYVVYDSIKQTIFCSETNLKVRQALTVTADMTDIEQLSKFNGNFLFFLQLNFCNNFGVFQCLVVYF